MNIAKVIFLLIVFSCFSTLVWSNQSYNWSERPNYSELRKNIGWSKDYKSKCDVGSPLSKIVKAMNSKDWEKAVAIGDPWLNQCPIDIRAHYYMGISMEKLGRMEYAKNHFRWTRGLMHDLMASGDGKTPETAYKVISVSEEHDVLYFLGLKVKTQALILSPVMCDFLTAVDKNGKKSKNLF